MLPIPVNDSDDPAFLALAERAITREAELARSEYLHLVKIDTWFGDRWFWFSGKTLGAAGLRMPKLTVPPFHPHRVLSESRIRLGANEPVPFAPLHTLRTSQANLRNVLARLGESITYAWLTGDTAATHRGAIMVYNSTGPTAWFAALQLTDHWHRTKLVSLAEREWQSLTAASPATA